MNWRHLIFLFSFLMFSPAIVLLMAGFIIVPQIVIMSLSNWNLAGLIFLLPLIGGGVGLVAAFFVTFDFGGKTFSYISMQMKRFGLIVGITSELFIFLFATPGAKPFLYFWFPPLFGTVVLLILSFKVTINKPLKQDK